MSKYEQEIAYLEGMAHITALWIAKEDYAKKNPILVASMKVGLEITHNIIEALKGIKTIVN